MISPRPVSILLCLCWLLLAVGLGQGGIGEGHSDLAEELVLTAAPSCMVAAPGGGWIMGMDQAGAPRLRCALVDQQGKLHPYPTESMATAAPGELVPLHAVEDVQVSADGLVWLLDNGRRSEATPKLVGWNAGKEVVAAVYHLAGPAVLPGSFLAELVIDPESPLVVVSDPANDANAALLLLDRSTGVLRRVLQGHPALRPDPTITLPATGVPLRRRLDGRSLVPHSGVRAMKIDEEGEWLYFAPVKTKKLYRLPMRLLRDTGCSAEQLAAAVETYSDSGPCGALAIDEDGNLYVGDMQAMGVCVVPAEGRSYRPMVTDAQLLRPDGLTFGAEGQLHFFSRSGVAAMKGDMVQVQHIVYRIKPLAEGRAGR